jgi:hypothetical protein
VGVNSKIYREICLCNNLDFFASLIEMRRNGSMGLALMRQPEWLVLLARAGFVDWRFSVDEIRSFNCAFGSFCKGESTFSGDRRVFLRKVSMRASDGALIHLKTDLFAEKSANWLCVALRDATMTIEGVCDESENIIIEGVKVGNRLFNPRKCWNALSLEIATRHLV